MKLTIRRYSGKRYDFEIDDFELRYNTDTDAVCWMEAWIKPDSVVGEEKEGE